MVKRRSASSRPLISTGSINKEGRLAKDVNSKSPFPVDDDVGQFVRRRHRLLSAAANLDSQRGNGTGANASDDDIMFSKDREDFEEPELHETEILPVDLSDSDSENNDVDSADDDDGDDDDGGGEQYQFDATMNRRDWGAKRHIWYGGDTHEYEVMPDEQRNIALEEEEEEAIALQKSAVDTLLPQDFTDGDVDMGLSDDDSLKRDNSGLERLDDSQPEDSIKAAPEIPILIEEAVRCEREMKTLQPRVASDYNSALFFHLYATFIQNVACFLAIRSDPSASHVDVRSHPVVTRIAIVRALIEKFRASASAMRRSEPFPPSLNNDTLVGEPRNSSNGSNEPDGLSEISDDAFPVIPGDRASKNKKDKKGAETPIQRSQKVRPEHRVKISNPVARHVFDEDDEEVNGLLNTVRYDTDDSKVTHDNKHHKINRLVGEMERNRHNLLSRRSASADAVPPRGDRRMQSASIIPPTGDAHLEAENRNESDATNNPLREEFENESTKEVDSSKRLSAKERRESRKARKSAEVSKPHVYSFNDSIEPGSKRKASKNVVANRGLTRYRARSKKTPRTKNRLAYDNAVKKRRSVVREFAGYPGLSYSGEATGINMASRKGSNLSSF